MDVGIRSSFEGANKKQLTGGLGSLVTASKTANRESRLTLLDEISIFSVIELTRRKKYITEKDWVSGIERFWL